MFEASANSHSVLEFLPKYYISKGMVSKNVEKNCIKKKKLFAKQSRIFLMLVSLNYVRCGAGHRAWR